jgi:hypothetical protein
VGKFPCWESSRQFLDKTALKAHFENLAGTAERAANAAAELCEDGPLLTKPHEEIVLDHIKQLLATRAREGEN